MLVAEVPDLLPALPEIFLALAAMALLMVGVFQSQGSVALAVNSHRQVTRLGLAALIVTLLLVVFNSDDASQLTFGEMFIVDGFSDFFKVLILFSSGIGLVMAREYLELYRIARFEYPVLILFATLGMLMMVSANDFMSLYLGLELQSLSLYVIASFHRDDVRSNEAGLKYFVLGALASGLLLYGASMIYGFSGTTNFSALATVFEHLGEEGAPIGVIVGLVFVLAGLAFKVSAVPFHMWTPDVYEGAPTPVTAFFSVAPKLAAIALLMRVMIEPFGELFVEWQQIIIFVSIASMLLGAFAALGQSNIKRLMAYSSIGHVGYALIGLAVGNEDGLSSVLVYMGIYIVMNIGVFTCILCMRRREQMMVNISDLSGVSKTSPMMALALAIFLFSMAGIPPLAGFFGKLYIFLSAVEAGLYALAIIGVLSSVVSAYYYLRIVKIMYFDEAGEGFDREFGSELRFIMVCAAAFILLFFLVPSPLLSSAAHAAAALFGA
ncbi:MAG: NADH-quinone oxidoreductase subunit NuoN [Hyphomicrobiales bacterium]|nr:NADH-quinone oxidoreductase subunit NuoN [Hyphomicrobiales bacterium]